jgi:hypothetical protein
MLAYKHDETTHPVAAVSKRTQRSQEDRAAAVVSRVPTSLRAHGDSTHEYERAGRTSSVAPCQVKMASLVPWKVRG